MKFPSKETIEQYRREYPVGCQVELISMDTRKLLRKAQEVRFEGSMTQEICSSAGITAPY